MSMPKQIGLIALGAIMIVVAVLVWKYATSTMTNFVETAWCATIEKAEECRYRGYQHFLIWIVIGIVNMLILGLIIDRLGKLATKIAKQ